MLSNSQKFLLAIFACVLTILCIIPIVYHNEQNTVFNDSPSNLSTISASSNDDKQFVTVGPTPTIIALSQSSSYTDPSSVIAIIELIVSIFTLGFIIKYVLDTASMAKATRESAEATRKSSESAEKTLLEMKEARETENAPFVIVYFRHLSSTGFLYLVVKNLGKTVAKNIKLEFDPPLKTTQLTMDAIKCNPLLNDGIPALVPNYELYIYFDFTMNYIREKLPRTYHVKVNYFDQNDRPIQALEYILDLNEYEYHHVHEGDELKQISETLRLIETHFTQYIEQSKSLIYRQNDISNALNANLSKIHQVFNKNREDIILSLKGFVNYWDLMYGKDKNLQKKLFLFELRSKVLLLSEDLCTYCISNENDQISPNLQNISIQLFKLGNTQLINDGYMLAYSSQGSSLADFDNLGDSIITDIKALLQKIAKQGDEEADPVQ